MNRYEPTRKLVCEAFVQLGARRPCENQITNWSKRCGAKSASGYDLLALAKFKLSEPCGGKGLGTPSPYIGAAEAIVAALEGGESPTGEPTEEEPLRIQIDRQKLRQIAAQADLAEIERDQKRGKLILAEEVKHRETRIAGAFTKSVSGIARKLAPLVAHKPAIEVERVIAKEIKLILDELSANIAHA